MTGVVLLRDVAEDDLPVLFRQQWDPPANEMAAFPARSQDAFMAHWGKVLVDGSVIKKTIVLDGQVAGNIVSFEQSGESRVGYWIGREFWGRGIATQALCAFLDCVPKRPLHARVAKHNKGSLRVLVKCGFTICGEDQTFDGSGRRTEEFILKLGAAEVPRAPTS